MVSFVIPMFVSDLFNDKKTLGQEPKGNRVSIHKTLQERAEMGLLVGLNWICTWCLVHVTHKLVKDLMIFNWDC